jgi:hypothetical protein
MSGGPDVVRMLLASMVLLSLIRLAAGVLLLRRRAALAERSSHGSMSSTADNLHSPSAVT